MKIKNKIAVLLTSFMTIATVAQSTEKEKLPLKLKEKKSAPQATKSLEQMEITADNSSMDYENQIITFTGNVKVKDPQIELESDKMIITLTKEQQIKDFVATGNNSDITIILHREGDDDIIATGEEATYDALIGKIILRGENTTIVIGANKVTGAKEVIFFVNENGITDCKTVGGRSTFTINHKDDLLKRDKDKKNEKKDDKKTSSNKNVKKAVAIEKEVKK